MWKRCLRLITAGQSPEMRMPPSEIFRRIMVQINLPHRSELMREKGEGPRKISDD